MGERDIWKCPKCGHIVTDQFYKSIGQNVECPGCVETSLSEFHLIEDHFPEPEWPNTIGELK